MKILNSIIYLLQQIKHKLWLQSLDFESWKDKKRLYNDFPGLEIQLLNSNNEFYESYIYYTSKISNPKMAISFNLARFVLNLTTYIKPKTILDLGSGYSTYIFARYRLTKNQAIKLWSVDDNRKWLSKTRSYLKHEKLTTTKLIDWDTFRQSHLTNNQFQFILYDLGTTELRMQWLLYILNQSISQTYIIIDDMHMLKYSRFVRNLALSQRIKMYSLRSFTKDKYGRFSVLLVK